MRRLLTILIGLSWTTSVYAECGSGGLTVYPSEQTVRQNSIFILEGYGHSQEIILGLNKKYSIYLKSGDKKIRLSVSEIYVGQFRLTQAILKPETELEAGLEYLMCVDSLPTYEQITKYNSTTKKYEGANYTVATGKDTEKPVLSSIPKEIKKTYIRYGCGPSTHVVFDLPIKDSSEVFVKTTVKDLKTGLETIYYIEPYNNHIEVGHDMCSGAFKFTDNSSYEVEFSFMDASGNVTAWTGERIKFTEPQRQ